MRFPPALIALAALSAAVVGGSVVLNRTAGEAGATPRATATKGSAGQGGTTAADPVKEVPQLSLPDPLPTTTVRVPILMYHRVAVLHGDETGTELDLTVDPQEFTLEMQWLKDSGFTTITQLQLYKALMAGAALPEKPILLTFDDGYRGIATIAAPIMERYGFVGTAYVITDRIARRPSVAPSWMTWRQLRGLEEKGWDIGSHTVSHREVPSLTPDEARTQLRASRFKLERILGHPVQWFCYPAGRVDAASVEEVRDAGYVLAVTTAPGDTLSAQRPLELPRVRVSNTTGVRGLTAALG